MTRPIVLAVNSDIHCGSTLGVCPPEGVRLDDGATYHPSGPQRWLWECWTIYWDRVRRHVEELKADLWCVYNGDLFEGDHHHTSQIISRNPEPQSYVSDRVFGVPSSLKPAHTFIVRGTEAHVGPSAATEEAFARSIKAVGDPETKKWSWWHLRMAPHGVLVDFQHHPSTKGSLPWTRPQAAQRLAFRIWSEHRLRELDAPRIVFRSHLHQFADSGDAYPVRAIVTPAWQLKTAHAHKVAADSIADVGGCVVTIEPNQHYTIETWRFEPDLPPVWSPNAD